MIETYSKRMKLKPRNTPYRQKLSVGKYVGFYRANAEGGGTWRARRLINGQWHFRKLGGDIRSDFDDILILSNDWSEQVIKLSEPGQARHTVQSVVDHYIRYLEIENVTDSVYRTRKQLESNCCPNWARCN